ncbi:uncharacterized protein THITE_2119310 [Thermothielavioides terrestris NRRL 8126]|uniref:C2H2-type domain-containing protein n=1 Tax=Thermothielavioides terrestris (strain ATCC 38088 / NRRL 8126) TaxID=578455 RepID=G2RBL4_THETT|nr:uncharacterized protein THITE_2119310 [Thermothielavioides terrestris NRRL 8126]AEO69185.1 hypothetical protein THITE_2119310 [Thermothielavioides terrestris NRRL 8126]
MSTTVPPKPPQVPVSDPLYDPDEGLPRNSPPLEPLRPTLRPSQSPEQPQSSSTSPSPSPGRRRPKRRYKPKPGWGDAILISHLDGHRRETAAYANIDFLSSESEDSEDSGMHEESVSSGRDGSPDRQSVGGGKSRARPSGAHREASGIQKMPSGSRSQEDMGAFDLKSLAADALAVVSDPQPPPDAGPTPPVTDNDVAHPAPAPMALHTRRAEPLKDDRHAAPSMPSPYSPRSLYSPRDTGATPSSSQLDVKSPTASIPSGGHGEGLPPIQLNSPRYEANGQTLPSIRSQLGDIQHLSSNPAAGTGSRPPHHGFPGSPPASMPRLPSFQGHLVSPPMPPGEPYRDPLSPGQPLPGRMMSPGYYYAQTNGLSRQREYAGSSTEVPGSNPPGSATAASGRDKMSIDGLTIQSGTYVCKVPGCTAPPFQTQYLLNSHANVHSSARPHYCPVPGCSRGEGGKGFKRKNEMIRHGLVHNSPGYVCPFCPDREHKYPRPDNLQRHVRVHHMDKDKDDPLLREVLAQRPGGPSRGRRRRGGPG